MLSGSVMVTALESSSAERPGTTVNAAAANMAAGTMRRIVSMGAPSESSYRSYLTREFHICNLLTACALAAYGQMNTGEISGAVKDQLGGLLPGATIIAQQAAKGLKFTAVSNETGEYLLAQLPVGPYSVKVSAPNFKQSELPKIEVHALDKLRYDFTLQVGGANETVTIEANAEVQPESAEIKDVIGNQQVIALPLKAREFLDLAMLSEGVVRPPGGTRGDALQQAGTLVNVLGQRSGHNLYLIDGATVTDEHFNNMVIAPSIEAISEFNIQKTSYAPEFGGKSGAVINVVTRSGSNDVHGSLFEFVRNDIFDAKNFFDSPGAPIPPFRQNQFGGSFGGPVIRNRTFFFVSYEGQRVRKSLTQTFSVPTAQMRDGDFSGLPTIYDPNNGAGGQRQPFAGNRIPVQGLDPIATAILSEVPLPNLAGVGLNLLDSQAQRINTNAYSARVDHQFARK